MVSYREVYKFNYSMRKNQLGVDDQLAGRWQDALWNFTTAIREDPQCAIFWSNRAVTHLSLLQGVEAERDARKAIRCCPAWFKGYQRLGAALALQSAQVLQESLEWDPDNRTIREMIRDIDIFEYQSTPGYTQVLKARWLADLDVHRSIFVGDAPANSEFEV